MGQSRAVSDPDRFRRELFIGVSYRIEETAVTRTDRRTIGREISQRFEKLLGLGTSWGPRGAEPRCRISHSSFEAGRHCSLSIERKVWPAAKHNFPRVVGATDFTGTRVTRASLSSRLSTFSLLHASAKNSLPSVASSLPIFAKMHRLESPGGASSQGKAR